MLTSNQRDIVAGILTSISANRVQGLSIEQIIKMYELTRKSVEDTDISKNEKGMDE
jgi:transposase